MVRAGGHRGPPPAPAGRPGPPDRAPAPLPQEDAVLDDIIDRLLDVRNGRPGKQVTLTEQEVSPWGGGEGASFALERGECGGPPACFHREGQGGAARRAAEAGAASLLIWK